MTEQALIVASRLLDHYRITNPPVPDSLVYLLGDDLLVRTRSLPEDLPGALIRGNPCSVIWLRQEDAPTRRRFTLFHELGHYLLHQGVVYCFATGYEHKQYEREANRFASELLMPTEWLQFDVHERRIPRRHLPARYLVSPTAMRIRLQELGL